MTLYSYTIPIDDGAAPNPFGGICTLVICKPRIRSTAQEGDWIAGLGSRSAPSGDLSGRLVYAMRVDEVLTMKQYDRQASARWPTRIPDVNSKDLSRRLGDCLYDFSTNPPTQRPGVHNLGNQEKDLSGKNALISRHFFYFGSKAIPLPTHLLGIAHQTQGHRSDSNASLARPFVEWIHSLNLAPGQLYGWPDHIVDWSETARGGCAVRACDDD